MNTTTSPRYVSTADCAKLVRRALKVGFPGVKFSVTSKTYSGGSSVSVHWVDGPKTADVEAVARQYQGGGFDGSIDLKYYSTHWLRPDGRVILAKCDGTTTGKGSVSPQYGPYRALTPDAELVRFCADYVFCSRSISPERKAEIIGAIEIVTGRRFDSVAQYPDSYPIEGRWYCIGNPGYTYGSDLLLRVFNESGDPLWASELVND